MSEEVKIDFVDKRRIKSVEDTCDDAPAADLDRIPTVVERLKSQTEASDTRLREYIAAHKEKMAEIDQLRKRLEADVERRANVRFGELVCELLPVIDNIDLAISHAAKDTPDDPMLRGVRLLRDGLFKVLTARGLEMVDCEGKPFDPETTQAVAVEHVEDDDKDNIVLEQLAAGYIFDGRVLRPSLARVGRKA